MELNSNFIEKLFNDILNYSYLLPLLILAIFFKKSRLNWFTITFVAYFISFFCLNQYYSEIKTQLGQNGYYFTYTLLEFSSFTFFLWYFIEDKTFRRLCLILSALFVTFLIIFYLTVNIRLVDSIPIGVETILIFIFIFYYFFQYFKNTNNRYIYQDPSFWLTTGILVYLGGTFFFNILASSMAGNDVPDFYYLTFLGDIIKNIFCSVAIALYMKKENNTVRKSPTVPYLDLDII